MKIATTLFLFVVVGCTWREALGTCVLESDFGFTLNCAFKKSGLFRVRNLGGVKGYVGLGFSIGDELGFRDSLTNLEVSRRRSVQPKNGFPPLNANGVNNKDNTKQQRSRMSVPPFKPLPGGPRPMAQQPEHQRLIVQNVSHVSALKPMPGPTFAELQEDVIRNQQRMQAEAKLKQQQRTQQELIAMQMLKQQRQQQQEAMKQQQQQQEAMKQQQQQQEAMKQQQQQQQEFMMKQQQQQVMRQQQEAMRHQQQVHLQKVQFPQEALQPANQIKRIQQMGPSVPIVAVPIRVPSAMGAIPPAGSVFNVDKMPQPMAKPMTAIAVNTMGLPPFVGMPASAAQLTDRISPALIEDSVNEVPKYDNNQLPLPIDETASSANQVSVSVQAIPSADKSHTQDKNEMMSSLPSLAPIQAMGTSLKALAEASNITLEALEAAILLRQQQLLQKQQGPTTTSTTLRPTPAPNRNKHNSGATKVMNAPREYYPVNYDKNFDDNFASRVDLPDTTFYCGDQKHFPGLYADEDLGCMVFHVCALTDDGLIMKSFLCPESTLFDQTILKCNWWFYVDCKTSKSLYDSNIPISKSYQLMKALAFFSSYKSHDNSTHHSSDKNES